MNPGSAVCKIGDLASPLLPLSVGVCKSHNQSPLSLLKEFWTNLELCVEV